MCVCVRARAPVHTAATEAPARAHPRIRTAEYPLPTIETASPVTSTTKVNVSLSPGVSAHKELFVSFGAAAPANGSAAFSRVWPAGVAAGTWVEVDLPAGVVAGQEVAVHARAVSSTGTSPVVSKNLTVAGARSHGVRVRRARCPHPRTRSLAPVRRRERDADALVRVLHRRR